LRACPSEHPSRWLLAHPLVAEAYARGKNIAEVEMEIAALPDA
jgi:hypothetical protein